MKTRSYITSRTNSHRARSLNFEKKGRIKWKKRQTHAHCKSRKAYFSLVSCVCPLYDGNKTRKTLYCREKHPDNGAWKFYRRIRIRGA